jgi:hypothetical protein
MWKSKMRALVADEAGTGMAEISLFIGFVFLTGVGFVCFSAGQLIDASGYADAMGVRTAQATRL